MSDAEPERICGNCAYWRESAAPACGCPCYRNSDTGMSYSVYHYSRHCDCSCFMWRPSSKEPHYAAVEHAVRRLCQVTAPTFNPAGKTLNDLVDEAHSVYLLAETRQAREMGRRQLRKAVVQAARGNYVAAPDDDIEY